MPNVSLTTGAWSPAMGRLIVSSFGPSLPSGTEMQATDHAAISNNDQRTPRHTAAPPDGPPINRAAAGFVPDSNRFTALGNWKWRRCRRSRASHRIGNQALQEVSLLQYSQSVLPVFHEIQWPSPAGAADCSLGRQPQEHRRKHFKPRSGDRYAISTWTIPAAVEACRPSGARIN